MEEVEEEESVADRYAKMVKHDKLALLMIALGPNLCVCHLLLFFPLTLFLKPLLIFVYPCLI